MADLDRPDWMVEMYCPRERRLAGMWPASIRLAVSAVGAERAGCCNKAGF